MTTTSDKIKGALTILFWGGITLGCAYSVKASIDELRDPIEKEKRKVQRKEACNVFNKSVDKVAESLKKVYGKIAQFDETLDNSIPPYEPEISATRLSLLKAKRDKLEKQIEELENLSKDSA